MRKQSFEDPQSKGIMNQFKQQLMKAWQPVPTLNKTIIIFTVLGTVFITLGILIQIYATHITEYYVDYNDCQQEYCQYPLEITSNMAAPVFLFYQLKGFYQNHRLYIASISLSQLKGNNLSVSDIKTECQPIVTNADVYKTESITGQQLDPSAAANPCGLIALSMFNDSYAIISSTGQQIPTTSNGIAWPSDLQLYKANYPDLMWQDTTDERFMVWMRVAALPNFRKVWARVNSQIPAGNYTLRVQNLYNISQFGASKQFVIAQSNQFGSKDVVMSISYLTVGGACIIFLITFSIVKVRKVMKARKQRQQ